MASLNVEHLYNQAIDFCGKKSARTKNEIIDALIKEESWVHSTLRYALAKTLCEYFTAEEDTIRAIYIFGSSVKDTASFISDIDLIFWVSRKSKKLDALLRNTDVYLTGYYIALIGNKQKNIRGLLDFKIVSDEEVDRREGFGSVIASLHEPPIKIWCREA